MAKKRNKRKDGKNKEALKLDARRRRYDASSDAYKKGATRAPGSMNRHKQA